MDSFSLKNFLLGSMAGLAGYTLYKALTSNKPTVEELTSNKPVVSVVAMKGQIGGDDMGPMQDVITMDRYRDIIDSAFSSRSLDMVILSINSPGGISIVGRF